MLAGCVSASTARSARGETGVDRWRRYEGSEARNGREGSAFHFTTEHLLSNYQKPFFYETFLSRLALPHHSHTVNAPSAIPNPGKMLRM